MPALHGWFNILWKGNVKTFAVISELSWCVWWFWAFFRHLYFPIIRVSYCIKTSQHLGAVLFSLFFLYSVKLTNPCGMAGIDVDAIINEVNLFVIFLLFLSVVVNLEKHLLIFRQKSDIQLIYNILRLVYVCLRKRSSLFQGQSAR